jgi:hypothetical protein
MLHLYQEQAGMAVDDLLAYQIMLRHYNNYMRMGPEASPDARILHTDRDITKFDKRIFRRMAELKYSPGNGKPSPFTIATQFLYDEFFSFRPISAAEIEAVFEWNDQGIERDEIYDPKNADAFLQSIARSEAGCRCFKERVQDLLEQMDRDDLVQRVNRLRSGLVQNYGRGDSRIDEFDAAFNPEFINLEALPWW